jgi:peroxisome-assembly ATPase
LPVRMGRFVHVPKSNQNCAWFEFEDLCHRPLGAADYLSICERYKTLIVDHVPQLDGTKFNEARRFVTLIDAVYESKTRLILASNHVPLDELFVGFDATVESNDGDEETAVDGIVGAPPDRTTPPKTTTTTTAADQHEIFVKGEGGSSSSSSTTMIRSHDDTGGAAVIEWSATGRIGVSLAQLSAVKDVSFSFQRAESRLAEINNGRWGQ